MLVGGQAFFFGDLALYFIPQLDLQRHELLAGRILLWNPYVMCGVPFVGNPQTWPLYPSSVLLFVLSPERAVGVIGAGHCLLAALGMRALLRGWGRSEAAATLAGVAFGFGGTVVSKCQFPNMVQAIAYLPWLIAAIDGVRARPYARRIAWLGALSGLALLAAHPQITLMQAYLCIAYVLATRVSRRALGALSLSGALGLLLSAAYWLPAAQVARDSVRVHLSLGAANRFHVTWAGLLPGFVAPNWRGNPAFVGGFDGPGNFWEPCAYLGLLPFALAIFGAIRLRSTQRVRFLAAAAVVALWLSLGIDGGLFRLAYAFLPGVSRFHDPARFLIVAAFCGAALAGFGLDALRPAVHPRWRRLVVGAVVVVGTVDILGFSATLNPTVSVSVFDDARVALRRSLSGAVRVVHRENRAVWRRYVRYRSYHSVASDDDVRGFLRSGAPNLAILAAVRDGSGYEPVHPAAYRAWVGTMPEHLPPDAAVDRELGAAGAARAVDRPVPRAWLGERQRPCRIDDATPQRVRVWLPPGSVAGRLVLADTRAPGWEVQVDAVPARIDAGPGPLRSVTVSAGTRSVDFRYDPAVWRVGAFLTLCAAGILAGFLPRFRGGGGVLDE